MKKFFVLGALVVVMFTFASCNRNQQVTEVEETTVAQTQEEETQENIENHEEETTSIPKKAVKKWKTINPEFQLYKEQLPSEDLKDLYDIVLEKAINFEDYTIYADNYTLDEIYLVIHSVKYDNPELWLYFNLFVNDNKLIPEVVLDYVEKWYYFSDECDPDNFFAVLDKCNKVCDEIIAKMPQNLTDEQKYKFLADELCEMTEYGEDRYDEERVENYDGFMTGPLLHGKAVCQGYAHAYSYLCQRAGLACSILSSKKICHSWNMIRIDGKLYHCDTTCYDSGGNQDLLKFDQQKADETYYPNENAIVAK